MGALRYFPAEGLLSSQRGCCGGFVGPRLSDLRNYRWTFPQGITAIKDDWRKDSGEFEVCGNPIEWLDKCVFYERWSTQKEEDEEEDRLHLEMKGLGSYLEVTADSVRHSVRYVS